jgi:hypothetical protein
LAPDPLTAALQREVPPGERLAWSGRPQGLLVGTGIPHIGVVAALGAFVGMLVAPSFAYLALAVGAYALDAAWRQAVQRGTIYGLTERHAIMLSTFPRRRLTLVPLDQLEGVAVEPTALGFGPVTFQQVARPHDVYDRQLKSHPIVPAAPSAKGMGLGEVVAGLILLWIAVLILSLVHGPSIMGNG